MSSIVLAPVEADTELLQVSHGHVLVPTAELRYAVGETLLYYFEICGDESVSTEQVTAEVSLARTGGPKSQSC